MFDGSGFGHLGIAVLLKEQGFLDGRRAAGPVAEERAPERAPRFRHGAGWRWLGEWLVSWRRTGQRLQPG
jgi:hypothetical protein